MQQRGEHTLNEITTQPDAWAEAMAVGADGADQVRALWARQGRGELLFTGCGSTYYLSLVAASLARGLGLCARAMPASEVWLFPEHSACAMKDVLLVAISRSGETSETIHALDAYRRAGGRGALAITCHPSSTLCALSDTALAVPAAQEISIAQTRSFSSMLILCRALVAALADGDRLSPGWDALPDHGSRLIARYAPLAAELAERHDIDRFFFLGSGPRYGLACEAMLKMKEMSLSYSEAYHSLEFRHGPKSMVNEASLVVALLSEQARAQEAAVVTDMRALGAETLALGAAAEYEPLVGADHEVRLEPTLSAADRLVLYLPILQLMAYHRALANGQDPDAPHNLTAVVAL